MKKNLIVVLMLLILNGLVFGMYEKRNPEKGVSNNKKIIRESIKNELRVNSEKITNKSMIAKEGIKGDKGAKGEKGRAGKSAYEIWLEIGNKGSKKDFIESLSSKKNSDLKNKVNKLEDLMNKLSDEIDDLKRKIKKIENQKITKDEKNKIQNEEKNQKSNIYYDSNSAKEELIKQNLKNNGSGLINFDQDLSEHLNKPTFNGVVNFNGESQNLQFYNYFSVDLNNNKKRSSSKKDKSVKLIKRKFIKKVKKNTKYLISTDGKVFSQTGENELNEEKKLKVKINDGYIYFIDEKGNLYSKKIEK